MLKKPMMMQILNVLFIVICVKTQSVSQSSLSAVGKFREYLRIDTSKEENLDVAVEFWIRQAKEVGLPYTVHAPAGKPVFVATWEGADPALPSIMLNSHMDVVPVDGEEWKYPPFDAHMEENGDIYARGAQDAKDVSVQYMEAIRILKSEGVRLARTLHFTVMPDEEIGGENGMKAFVKTEEFKSLNIGFALDEGACMISNDTIQVPYQDKRPWQFILEIDGVAGHGSMFVGTSAMENVYNFMKAAMAYRETQQKIANNKAPLDYGAYTTLNINIVHGGKVINVIPSTVTLGVDMRLATDADTEHIQAMIDSWIRQAGNSTRVTFLRRELVAAPTAADDSNPFWTSMKNTAAKMGLNLIPIKTTGATDITQLRNLGIPAFGFSAKLETLLRAHQKDEYQNVYVFLKGIEIYKEIIQNLANVQ